MKQDVRNRYAIMRPPQPKGLAQGRVRTTCLMESRRVEKKRRVRAHVAVALTKFPRVRESTQVVLLLLLPPFDVGGALPMSLCPELILRLLPG